MIANTQGQLKRSEKMFLPVELAVKYYEKWDCDIQVYTTQSAYYKCLNGYGEVEFKNNNQYKGHFHNGLMHGQGEFLWSNGLSYKGSFEYNAITGDSGQYRWPDGSVYKGGLLNGKRNGYGEYYCAKDGSNYQGEWQNGIKHGRGILKFSEEAYYDGEFRDGLRHGKGKMKYCSGNIYEGDWREDTKCGYGTMNWATENQKYEGEWTDDIQDGLGTYYWFDAKIQHKVIKNVYKGFWKNGRRQGFGSFFYANGCQFEGFFNENQKQGFGLMMDDNGNIKLGEFQADKLIKLIPAEELKSTGKVTIKGPTQEHVPTEKPIKEQQTPKLKKVNANKLPSINRKEREQPTAVELGSAEEGVRTAQENTGSSSVKFKNLKIEENVYSKCLDIPIRNGAEESLCPEFEMAIDQSIINLLLRENSKLRAWYKHCSVGISTSEPSGSLQKQFYTGVTIQNLWKLIKDLKITDSYLTVARINREFSKGWKSNYDVAMPNQRKLCLIKEYLQNKCKAADSQSNDKNLSKAQWSSLFNTEQTNYFNIQWVSYCEYLEKFNSGIDPSQSQKFEEIELNSTVDVHNQKKIILFRHFVCYLLKIAYLQSQKKFISQSETVTSGLCFQKIFRNCLETLFKNLGNLFEPTRDSSKNPQSTDNLTYVSKQRPVATVSIEFTVLNSELFHCLTSGYQTGSRSIDKTVSVKVLYQLLQKFNIIKEPVEKMFFLEKIQRWINTSGQRGSVLKKENKQHFAELEKIVYTSSYFEQLLNYPLVQKQFEDLLYLAVNRKIHSSNKEDSIKKYKETVRPIIEYSQSLRSVKAAPKLQWPTKSKVRTEKDRLRAELLRRAEQKRIAELEAQAKRREMEAEARETHLMEKEDFRWEEDDLEESDDYFD